jgi:hypothetical protein
VGFEMKTNPGTKDRGDIWLHQLSAQVNRACNLFWTRTAERREIEARRLRRGFGNHFPVDKPSSCLEKPDN